MVFTESYLALQLLNGANEFPVWCRHSDQWMFLVTDLIKAALWLNITLLRAVRVRNKAVNENNELDIYLLSYPII